MELIEKQAAIKAIENLQDCYNGFSDTYDKACIIGVLEEVPSVDVPDRKVGKWIDDKGMYKCSVCNNLWAHWWIAACSEGWMYKEMKFCPNCGAKMEGENG